MMLADAEEEILGSQESGNVMYIADQNSLRILTEGCISTLWFNQTLFYGKVEVPVRIFQELLTHNI